MTDTITAEAAAESAAETCAVPEEVVVSAVEPALVAPALAAAAVAGGALLIDVRSEPTRVRQGAISGALIGDRTRVPQQFDPESAERLPGVEDRAQPIVVICGSENGSRPVATELLSLGFVNVVHVAGGAPAWRAAGLPIEPGEES